MPYKSASDNFSKKKCGMQCDAKPAEIKFYCGHAVLMELDKKCLIPGLISLSLNILCNGC